MLNELKTARKAVGIKQLRKALKSGSAKEVFLARDADPRLTEPVEEFCASQRVACVWVETMDKLGEACGIDVGAAAAALLA